MSTLKVNNITDLGDDAIVTDGIVDGTIPTYPGQILQTVTNYDASQFETTSSSTVEVTGWSASITPMYANSKILIMATAPQARSLTTGPRLVFEILRDGVALLNTAQQAVANYDNHISIDFTDSPNTTSEVVYSVGLFIQSGGSGRVNRRHITLMEVAG